MGGWVGQCMGSGQITNNLINLDLIEIIQFCLKIYDFVETPPPVGGLGGSVGQWVGTGQIPNNLINLDLIKIIQFCLKFMICRDTPTHGWVDGWVSGVGSG